MAVITASALEDKSGTQLLQEDTSFDKRRMLRWDMKGQDKHFQDTRGGTFPAKILQERKLSNVFILDFKRWANLSLFLLIFTFYNNNIF